MIVALFTVPVCALAGCYDRGGVARFRLQEGEALDTRTGLVWQRCSLGTRWNGKDGCTGETAYLGLDDAMAEAKEGWRVPTGPELESIVELECRSPVVDPQVFPDIRPDVEGRAKYWSTNPVGTLDLYWNFDFVDGHPDGNTRGILLAVRLVRSGK